MILHTSKHCVVCKQEKDIAHFYPTRNRCKQCYAIRRKEYRNKNLAKERNWGRESYYRHHDLCKQRKADRSRRIRQINNQLVHDYLLEHPCIDCGEADPRVLEFDHVRGVKSAPVSQFMEHSWARLFDEIYKCDVRCANCHARKTHIECGYFMPAET